MQTTVGRTRTHGYVRSVNDVSVAMATKRRKLRSPEDGFCNELDALLPGILLNADRKKFYQWQFTFAFKRSEKLFAVSTGSLAPRRDSSENLLHLHGFRRVGVLLSPYIALATNDVRPDGAGYWRSRHSLTGT
ncbi:hypothetical protein TNIN_267041 [Trichonephila inaurata madagascariensis]|uniref:Uncharacterized protein n=1 Tax=Trichonephila inaurata madagascariensis TaxID=2747483 RepID=A0A8X6YXU2_9ARAC|nr:hypothetical protein TNIN_267041 [Trichonephila inaurata madagascariensis]